jgi:hypothetical protein
LKLLGCYLFWQFLPRLKHPHILRKIRFSTFDRIFDGIIQDEEMSHSTNCFFKMRTGFGRNNVNDKIISFHPTPPLCRKRNCGPFRIGFGCNLRPQFLLNSSTKWWRRRESNPRPKALLSSFYVCRLSFHRQASGRRQSGCPKPHLPLSHLRGRRKP